MATLKCPYLIVPYLPPDDFKTQSSILKLCEQLNEGNLIAQENGFRLGYHNHWWEAEFRVNGKPAYQIMVECLDKEILFQVDTYWIRTGGLDAAEVIGELGERVRLIHIKDGPALKNEPMTAVGDGVLDWSSIIEAGDKYCEWLIVEMDRCATDAFEAVTRSYNYLTQHGFAYGKR
jgi:sugar phosphate isomerase/epimerase